MAERAVLTICVAVARSNSGSQGIGILVFLHQLSLFPPARTAAAAYAQQADLRHPRFILLRCFDQRPRRYSSLCSVIWSRILTRTPPFESQMYSSSNERS